MIDEEIKRFEEEFGKCEVERTDECLILKAGKFERRICFFEDGKRKYEWNLKDGRDEGKQFGWYENGNKKFELNFKNGKEEGKQFGFYKNGNKRYELNFKDGVRVDD